MSKIYISYNDYEKELNKLVSMIKKCETVNYIDGIYGIPRGGLPIAVHLSHYLDIPLYYTDFNFFNKSHDNILLVDDISDTGISFVKTIGSMTVIDSNINIITASLHIKKGTKYIPDFFVKEYNQEEWIVYPWERKDEEEIPEYKKTSK